MVQRRLESMTRVEVFRGTVTAAGSLRQGRVWSGYSIHRASSQGVDVGKAQMSGNLVFHPSTASPPSNFLSSIKAYEYLVAFVDSDIGIVPHVLFISP